MVIQSRSGHERVSDRKIRVSKDAAKEAEAELAYIIEQLENLGREGVRYTVVGGTAIMAHTRTRYEPLRTNRTVRDLDVIVLEDPHHKAAGFARTAQKRARRLPFTFNFAKPNDYYSPFQLIAGLKKNNGGYSLVFRGIEEPLHPSTMRVTTTTLQTSGERIKMCTLPPCTILHLYLSRMGQLKHKDITKIRSFSRLLRHERVQHAAFQAFHDFSRRVRKEYPTYCGFIRAYNWIDHLCGNYPSTLVPARVLSRLVEI